MEATVTLKATPSEFRLLRGAVELAEKVAMEENRDSTLDPQTRRDAAERAAGLHDLADRL